MNPKDITAALKTNKISLITYSDCCTFQEADFFAIAEALVGNTSLHSLDCGSKLTPASLLKFASAFERNHTLKKFEFYPNNRSNTPQDWQAATHAIYKALLVNNILVVKCISESIPFYKGIN